MKPGRLAFAIPGDLNTATGGYGYDRRIIGELQMLGWQVEVVRLGDGFPWPDQATLRRAYQRLAEIDPHTLILIDGLAFGVMPDIAEHVRGGDRLIALVHHPLCLEHGLSEAMRQVLRQSETQALRSASHVIVTSQATARLLPDFDVPAERVTTVYPGTESASKARGSGSGRIELLSVGTIIPRKGFDILIQALSRLKALDWHLTIAGDASRDLVCAQTLNHLIAGHGLIDRVTQTGVLTTVQLAHYYEVSDVFVLASRFEGYGMAYAEAMARGLPVIGTTGGAIADTVPVSAGLLVSPDDIEGLAQALHLVIVDQDLRDRLAAGAWQVAQQLPTWAASGLAFASVLSRFDGVAAG